ncbi:metallophosphoesterase [Conexibacter stalactiti]|uniref:Metallophosphoesterase n=1 Tax=Conexibacter stalactiti TaxID=1940611 RepID=A0ABU4HWD3_9ACTN|nr:metallophosphoesterase [Conexibacter stalactiti]MDW5597134.1 metallophosphoesterase [Conexibacter stalactiti]MEC5037776.1 metallophosphoesterase [Conexibacter stalactiti]
MSNASTRRRFLAGAGAASVGAAVAATPGAASAHGNRPPFPSWGRVRLLHFTDAHVTPNAARSETETLRALQLGLRYRPDLIVQGGDAIYDALVQDRASVEAQWAIHRRVYERVGVPVAHVIGNHDCWTGPGSAGDPLSGKAWAHRELGLERGWYARRLGAWKLIVLDSIELTGGSGYVGRLGAEQTAWLEQELAQTPASTHVVIASHIPLQTALPFTDAGLRRADGGFDVPGGWGVHSDLPEINELLLSHRNVRLALSGHNHVRDDITYNTVRFACGGAVSGNWWDASDPGYRDTPPGFAIVDLHRDGSSEIGYWSYREVGEREVSADGPATGGR